MKLIVVANRLPYSLIKKNGGISFEKSPGGMVSGLSAFINSLKKASPRNQLWIGWPGVRINSRLQPRLKNIYLSRYHSLPVFLPEKIDEQYYEGFCNKTIWPLFHYFTSFASYNGEYWKAYQKANQVFADTVLSVLKPGDSVLVQDYHLMLLPELLRKKIPNLSISFFLHIPFPTFEIFRFLPGAWREDILKGILGADLIGFHTYDYTQYFLRSVFRILGLEHSMGTLNISGRSVKVDTFPLGIDYKNFAETAAQKNIKSKIKKLKRVFGNRKIIISIDRLDYTKGIINRLLGYETFLEKNPQRHQKVTLLLVLIPSRTEVEQYQHLKKQIDETIGRINGRFAAPDWTPVNYMYTSLPFTDLVAYYGLSDIALITPLYDGMNLIAKEYLSGRIDNTGVLILSETAGAAKELTEAILINPNNKEEIALALEKALDMSPDEQSRRLSIMQERLRKYDINRWASDMTRSLQDIKVVQKKLAAKLLNRSAVRKLTEDYRASYRRLILLDYDGTLSPFTDLPADAAPSTALLRILEKLVSCSDNRVIIVSGRNRQSLIDWFPIKGLGLVAEYGAWVKEPGNGWTMLKPLTNNWKPSIKLLLSHYTDRLAGSFIEEKEYSLTWHYRRANPVLGSDISRELMSELVDFTANKNLQIIRGNKVIEVKNAGIDKAAAALHYLEQKPVDFIMAIGDDTTDEDMFSVLPQTAHSIKVGLTKTIAKYNLENQEQVIKLLKKFLRSGRKIKNLTPRPSYFIDASLPLLRLPTVN